MHFFHYSNGELYCEGVPIREIVETHGTPTYIYSYSTIKRHFEVFGSAFSGLDHLICYSLKANSSLSILKLLKDLGSGADIVSVGELYKALLVGIDPKKIVFSGVGKTEEEIREAVRKGILMINVESEAELGAISKTARRLKKRAAISFRINPEIDPGTHPFITTGLKQNKFGIPFPSALALYRMAAADPYLEVVGISSHIGSQILKVEPFREATRSLKRLFLQLKAEGIEVRYMDIGGGLGITYKDELPPHPLEYARVIKEEISDLPVTLVLEPGRVIVGNSGILVCRVLYVKKTEEKTFYIVDAAMNDLIRPALYGAYHEIWPVTKGNGKRVIADVVGPVCESSDFFAKDREIEELKEGDLISIMGAGAYGFSMASNYNGRRRPCEVIVKEGTFVLIRKRETYRDIMKNEIVAQFEG